MNDTLLRQWAMLRLIPRHPRKIDTGRLLDGLNRQGFQTTLRTVQRDLNNLSRALPLESDEAKPQGWWWSHEAETLDMPALDPQAALTFKLVEGYLQPLLPVATLDYLRPWFKSAAGVLEKHGNGLSKWPDKIRVLSRGQPQLAPQVDADAQMAIYQALLEEKRVAVVYLPSHIGAEREYEISPLALVVRDQVVYLVCTMWEYDDLRQLALHRVVSATLLDSSIRRPAGFDIDAYIAQGEFGFPHGGPIRLEVKFAASVALHLAECPLSEDQQISEIDADSVLLRATVQDTQELRWWLQSFGDEVEVRGPEALREEFKEIAGKLGKIYSDR